MQSKVSSAALHFTAQFCLSCGVRTASREIRAKDQDWALKCPDTPRKKEVCFDEHVSKGGDSGFVRLNRSQSLMAMVSDGRASLQWPRKPNMLGEGSL